MFALVGVMRRSDVSSRSRRLVNRGLGVRVPPSALVFPCFRVSVFAQVSALFGVPGGRLGPASYVRGRIVDAFGRIVSRCIAEERCMYYNLLYENAYDPH